jgi:hypothetical protein
MVKWWMDNEPERIYNQAVVAFSKCERGICLHELRKTTEILVRKVGVVAEIQTEHFPNKTLNRYL